MNIINAIVTLIKNPITDLDKEYVSTNSDNRANGLGDALERYIKELFSNSFNLNDDDKKEKESKVFSYLGNNSNPPDAMLKGGDAIEIKKISSFTADLALNSSYPKHKLFSNDPMISKACHDAEEWDEKDIIYAVGVVKDKKLKKLSFVYGEDYCASNECYEKIKKRLKNGISNIENLDFNSTKELGRLNKVDPLGITYLRIRGMWGIQNPWKAFHYLDNSQSDFNFMCLINENKWGTFHNTNELIALQNENGCNLKIEDVKIKDSDNPAKLKNAKLITFHK